MFHRIILSVFLFFACIANIAAQKDSLRLELKEIKVYGIPLEKYTAGSKIQQIDSLTISQNQSRNLGDLLMEKSPVYIKQYGNAMLGSVSFRGTGASHTAVLWNGLPIQSMTLGEADFSNLPLFAFDNLQVQYGGAGALYGSGAIGGTILLSSASGLKKGYNLQFQQQIGSFGHLFSGLSAGFAQGKLEVTGKLYHFRLDNDFTFINKAKFGFPREKQNNAELLYYGFLKEINYRFSTNRLFSLKSWYHFRNTEIQPLMGSNLDKSVFSFQKEKNIRLLAVYSDNSKIGFFTAKLGFIRDYLLYQGSETTATSRYFSALQYEKKLSEKISFQAGADWTHIRTAVDAYAKNYTENRNDFFALLHYKATKSWLISLNARQAFVSGFSAPFAPSLGSELTIFQKNRHTILLKNLFSKSYRVPTLNERYWNPGGNPAILPEKGWSAETGLIYRLKNKNTTWESEGTYYRMWVDKWIVWLPTGTFWSPHNIRKVQVSGLELSSILKYQKLDFQYTLGGNYAFTQSLNQKGINQTDTESLGKQLPYSPTHRGNVFASLLYKNWHLSGTMCFTGLRFIDLSNEEFLEAFTLVNIGAGKKFQFKKSDFALHLNIYNLLNKSYQNLRYYAMPLRNYQLSIHYIFNKN